MAFPKGRPRPEGAGRKAGTPNKITTTVRQAFEDAFNAIQSSPTANLRTWAEGNPTEFYKLSSKLIPNEIKADIKANVTVLTGVPVDD